MSKFGKVRIDLCKRMSVEVECEVDENGMPKDEEEFDSALKNAIYLAEKQSNYKWELDSDDAVHPVEQ